MNIEIKDKLYKNIEEFCQLNLIDDITSFINKLIEKEFTIHVYGDKPGSRNEILINHPSTKENKDNVQNNEQEVVDNVQNIEHYENGIELVTTEPPKRKTRRVLK
jgi:hypothetical protein